MSVAEGVTVQMTAEEHYALTALLRSAVTIGGLERVGLERLLERLNQPYLDEMMARGMDALAAREKLPALRAIDGYPVHIEVAMEHQHEGVYSSVNPLEWYRWPSFSVYKGDVFGNDPRTAEDAR